MSAAPMQSLAMDPRAEEIAIRLAAADGYGWMELMVTDRNRYIEYALAVEPMFDDSEWNIRDDECGEDR